MAREGRRGGRQARRAERQAVETGYLPPLERGIPVLEILDAEALERVHDASMRILEEIGIEFREDGAAARWKAAGADVSGHRIRIPRDLLMSLVAKAPETFTVRARNPERSIGIGGRRTSFVPTYGSPFVQDLDGTRRYATLADLETFHRLAHMAPAMHNVSAVICEPVDIPVPRRHLHITRSALRNSDKPLMGPVTAPSRAEDALAMLEIVFGHGVVGNETCIVALVNCNSPLVWDATMLGALEVYAGANQAAVVSPFVMAGANTAASTLACVAQLNAEALAGIAYAQIVRPGSPMIYGHFLATVSMKSGAPMAGTPEIAHMNLIVGQLARRYRLPWRSSGMTAGSKCFDAQSAYESVMNMFPVLLAGANYVMHSAGWNEAGLSANFAKFMVDCEIVEMLYRFGAGVRFDDFDEAMEAMREVGPGGHFFGTAHTRAHFQDAFFMPDLMDNDSFEAWQASGSLDTNARAIEAVHRTLAAWQEPPIDPAVAEALDDFVSRREAELPETGE